MTNTYEKEMFNLTRDPQNVNKSKKIQFMLILLVNIERLISYNQIRIHALWGIKFKRFRGPFQEKEFKISNVFSMRK